MRRSNPARTTSIVWWILTPVFLLMAFVFVNADIGDAAFAGAFFSFIMFITAIIVGIMYGSRAGALDRLLAGEGLLAHWTYEPAEWLQYAEKDYVADKQAKRVLALIISGFALAIGVFYAIFYPDGGIGV